MNSSLCPTIMIERPSLPGIHDLFGEHLALPIRRSSSFALNALSSSLPPKRKSFLENCSLVKPVLCMRSIDKCSFSASRTYYDNDSRERAPALSPHHNKSYRRESRELPKPHHHYTESPSPRMDTQRYPSSPHCIYREQDNYSPPSSTSSDDFESHLPTERKKLPAKYECEYCGKFFNRPSSLKIHHNTHTGQKPFPCVFPGCGRNFSVMSNMRRHARTHGDSAVLSTREQSDSELSGIQLTPAPGFPSMPNSRDSSRSATPHSYQTAKSANRITPMPRKRSDSVSSDSSI